MVAFISISGTFRRFSTVIFCFTVVMAATTSNDSHYIHFKRGLSGPISSLATTWQEVLAPSDEKCQRYVTFHASHFGGMGDMLEIFYIALSVAIVTKATFIVPNNWGTRSIHMNRNFQSRSSKGGYEGVFYDVLGLPQFKKWRDLKDFNENSIKNVPFDYVFYQPKRLQEFSCNTVLAADMHSCRTPVFSDHPTESFGGLHCLFQQSGVIHDTVRPLLQTAWESSTDKCRVAPLNSLGLREDRVNVVWHLRTGDICLKCGDSDYFGKITRFIEDGLNKTVEAKHVMTYQHRDDNRIKDVSSVMHADVFTSSVIEDVVCLFLRADILVTTGSSFPTAIAQFTRPFQPIVFVEINKDYAQETLKPDIRDPYLMSGSSTFRMENGDVKFYKPDDVLYLLRTTGVLDRIHGKPDTANASNMTNHRARVV